MAVPGFPYLRDWPFSVVAPTTTPVIWADRTNLKREVDGLVKRWAIHQSASLVVMWANLGAGKTHTLRYIEQEAPDNFLVSYAVLPTSVSTFVEVYQAVMQGLPLKRVAKELAAATAKRAKSPDRAPSDAARALWTLSTASDTALAVTAERWLQGEKLTAVERRQIGVTSWVKDNDDAVLALSELIGLALESGRRRVVFLIDEFQRVGELRQKNLNLVNQGIHTLYNANPRGLSLVLSMSFGVADNVKYHLTDEVRSRAEPNSIELHHLDAAEAREFLQALLDAYKDGSGPSPMAPFSSQAVDEVIALLEPQGITPRRLMQAFGVVLESAIVAGMHDADIDTDFDISADFARQSLAESDWER